MDSCQELASAFIDLRREHPHVKFDREVSSKYETELFILSFLCRHNGTAHPKELSEEFIISSARMAVILNHLEEKGCIVRLHDPKDNRQTIVQITPAGSEFFRNRNERIIRFITGLFEELGEHDAHELIRISRKMMHILAESRT